MEGVEVILLEVVVVVKNISMQVGVGDKQGREEKEKEKQRSRKGGGDRRGGYVTILDWSKGHRKKRKRDSGCPFHGPNDSAGCKNIDYSAQWHKKKGGNEKVVTGPSTGGSCCGNWAVAWVVCPPDTLAEN